MSIITSLLWNYVLGKSFKFVFVAPEVKMQRLRLLICFGVRTLVFAVAVFVFFKIKGMFVDFGARCVVALAGCFKEPIWHVWDINCTFGAYDEIPMPKSGYVCG